MPGEGREHLMSTEITEPARTRITDHNGTNWDVIIHDEYASLRPEAFMISYKLARCGVYKTDTTTTIWPIAVGCFMAENVLNREPAFLRYHGIP